MVVSPSVLSSTPAPAVCEAELHRQTLEVCHVSTYHPTLPEQSGLPFDFCPAFQTKDGLNLISAKQALSALIRIRMELQHVHFWTAGGRNGVKKKKKIAVTAGDGSMFPC